MANEKLILCTSNNKNYAVRRSCKLKYAKKICDMRDFAKYAKYVVFAYSHKADKPSFCFNQ